jgi:hypothetical protein
MWTSDDYSVPQSKRDAYEEEELVNGDGGAGETQRAQAREGREWRESSRGDLELVEPQLPQTRQLCQRHEVRSILERALRSGQEPVFRGIQGIVNREDGGKKKTR